MKKEIKNILNYVQKERGIETSVRSLQGLKRHVNKRMRNIEIDDYGKYFEFMMGHSKETDNLIDLLLIKHSSFFRESLMFEFLSGHILPLIINKKRESGKNDLRIWSAGCSSGEEAYSIAILVNEIVKDDLIDSVCIFATDMDEKELKKAEKGLYSEKDISNIKYGLCKKYFVEKDNQYKIKEDIMQMVKFGKFNLLDPNRYIPPASIYGNFDIVTCCNVLIYYNLEFQNIIFKKLYRSLSENGFLVLGKADRISKKYIERFKMIDPLFNIYQKL